MATFVLHGTALGGGVAIGRARVLASRAAEVPRWRIQASAVLGELHRLDHGLTQVADELHGIAADLPPDAPSEAIAMLEVHGLMLNDPSLVEGARQRIRVGLTNAEWAYAAQADELIEQFNAFEDPYLRDRAADVRQIVDRVVRALSGGAPSRPDAADGLNTVVVVAADPAPADLLQWRGAAAFAIDVGGTASHVAIVARGLGKPAVVGLLDAATLVRDQDLVIVDGEAGVLVVNPDAALVAQATQRQGELAAERLGLRRLLGRPSVTRDGVAIALQGNIELPAEALEALEQGAQGIGLLRSEFLFLNRSELPDEDEQYEAYREAVQAMAGHPVTIRTIDVGADKALPRPGTARTGGFVPSDLHGSTRALQGSPAEAENPALGRRAIRLCLAEPELFVTQLRAILRASVHGPVRLLLPMLSHQVQIDASRALLEQARQSLRERGVAFDPAMPVGGMIEVPAAAIAAASFARQFDFLSIGTNDLTQYTLAIDRADASVAALYDPRHPAVLRLIAHTIAAARRVRRPVCVCGEIAGDPEFAALLLGMGLREFSMHPASLLRLKDTVLGLDSVAARSLARQALRWP